MPIPAAIKLNTGAEIPTVGFGTWKAKPEAVELAVEHALKFGYRHVDTAAGYGSEAAVGKGIKASGVSRGEIFLTTKLNNPDHLIAADALDSSLEKLQTTYLDLWLMHWPAPMTVDNKADKSINWIDTWKTMEKLYKAHPDKVRAIGVSNVSVKYLEQLLAVAEVIPAVNQVELHPSCPQEEIVAFCKSKGIVVTAYSPLGSNNSPLLDNEVVKRIAGKYNVQPANVLISLQANRSGVNVLTKSVTNSRIETNFNIFDLTKEDIQELQDINRSAHFRVCHPSWTGWGSLGFPDCE